MPCLPHFYEFEEVSCEDEDETVITHGDNRLFPTFSNVEWIKGDILKDYRECYNTTDIFINTSCEHMLPMKWWGPEGPRSRHNFFFDGGKKDFLFLFSDEHNGS